MAHRRNLKRLLFMITAIASGSWLLAAIQLPNASRGLLFDEVDAVPRQRVGLVLGCVPRMPDGRPNLYLTYRIDAAARLYRAGKVAYLLLSGDGNRDGQNEVNAMRQGLISRGVPDTRIVLDDRGLRTFESIRRAVEVYGLKQFTIVSQRFHNERAVYIAQTLGLSVVGYNAQDPAPFWNDKMRYREPIARLLAVVDTHVHRMAPQHKEEPIQIGTEE